MLRSFASAGDFVDGIGIEMLSPVNHEGPEIFIEEDKSIEDDISLGTTSDYLINVKVKRLLPRSILQTLRLLYPIDEIKVVNLEVYYWISGHFYEGMEWEDFIGSEGAPEISIYLDRSVQEPKIECCPEDGWYDVHVNNLTIEQAKEVLAEINKVDAEYVRIEERRVCLAV